MNENNGTQFTMPVQPMYGGGFGGMGGFGNLFGADGSWLLLLILLCGGGWGGFGSFGGGMWPMMMGGAMGADMGWGLYPWLNNSEHISDGFRDQQLSTQISGLRSDVTGGFADTALGIAGINQNICQTGNGIQNALCQGFAGNVAAINGAQNALAQQMYTNQIADLERSFAAQTANTQGQNTLQAQLAQCCCDNRLATAQTQALVQSENCADRAALSDGIRDLLTAGTGNTQALLNTINGGIQAIKDQLCQDKIDAKNERIVELQNQLAMKDLAASQTAQTARLLADNAAQTQAVENYIRPQINPAYIVPNPYACYYGNNGNGCGCNGNGFIG